MEKHPPLIDTDPAALKIKNTWTPFALRARSSIDSKSLQTFSKKPSLFSRLFYTCVHSPSYLFLTCLPLAGLIALSSVLQTTWIQPSLSPSAKIILFMDKNFAQKELNELSAHLNHHANIETVAYISPEVGFERLSAVLKVKHSNLLGPSESLPSVFEITPCLHSLNWSQTKTLIQELNALSKVDHIQYDEHILKAFFKENEKNQIRRYWTIILLLSISVLLFSQGLILIKFNIHSLRTLFLIELLSLFFINLLIDLSFYHQFLLQIFNYFVEQDRVKSIGYFYYWAAFNSLLIGIPSFLFAILFKK